MNWWIEKPDLNLVLAEAFAIGYVHGKDIGVDRNPFCEETVPNLRWSYEMGFVAAQKTYHERE